MSNADGVNTNADNTEVVENPTGTQTGTPAQAQDGVEGKDQVVVPPGEVQSQAQDGVEDKAVVPPDEAQAQAQDVSTKTKTNADAAAEELVNVLQKVNNTPDAELVNAFQNVLDELKKKKPPVDGQSGGRRRTKRKDRKGSRKSRKGVKKGDKKSRKSAKQSKKGGRSRKNGSKHRKHSRAHKKH